MHSERLTLATMCGGAIQEKVDRALKRVAENIMDPNTDQGKKRTITLKITMKPNEEDYEDVEVSAEVSYSIMPEIGVKTQFYVNKDLENGYVSVMEHRRGEIKGQLDFSDIGLIPGKPEETETFDTETGEIIEPKGQSKVLDLRKAR